MAGSERFVSVAPTMGVVSDSLRFILNLTPRKGKLVRRPAIRAVEHGFSLTTNDTSATYPDGVGTAITNFGISDDYYSGIDFTGTPATTMNPASAPTHPKTGASGAVSAIEQPHNLIEEGIDIELINGKLVCIYLTRMQANNSGYDTQIYFKWSWHMPGDPRLGSSQPRAAGWYYNGTEYFVAGVWYGAGGKQVSDFYIGNEGASGHGLTGFSRMQAHAYTAAEYWNRRIHRRVDSFMFVGKNVGAEMVTGEMVGKTVYQQNITHDSILQWSSDPLKIMGTPLDITGDSSGNINRTDPFNSIYVGHPPKNAFAHAERRGQTLWYGFDEGGLLALSATVPTDDVLIDIPAKDLTGNRQNAITRSSTLWYSEVNSPVSLGGAGATTLKAGEHSAEAVGLAEYQRGTAVFTRDTIQYLQGAGAWAEGNATREIIHQGIGSDSRWSIKEVGNGVAFANKRGVFHLDMRGQVNKLYAFDELFEEGVVTERGPYDALQGVTLAGNSSDGIVNQAVTADVFPWAQFQVDKTRLDRAVGAVWEDLYILFISRTTDDVGDDNRLGLVWNWKENSFSTWLLPKNMGVRGWAYDGTLTTPFVMTRYGIALFDESATQDEMWVHASSNTTRNTILGDVPVPVLGQTHRFPSKTPRAWAGIAGGAGYVTSHAAIEHTAKYDDGIEDGPTGAGSSYAMHIQLWTQTSDLSTGKATQNVNDITNSKNLVLANLFNGGFTAWSKDDESSGSFHYKSGSSSNRSYLVNGPIVRTSVARSGGHALRHRMQFYTMNHSDIHSIMLGLTPISPRGRRS